MNRRSVATPARGEAILSERATLTVTIDIGPVVDAIVAQVVTALGRPTENPDSLLTVAETAERLRVSESMVKKLIAASEIESVRIGDRRLVSTAALHRFITRDASAAV